MRLVIIQLALASLLMQPQQLIASVGGPDESVVKLRQSLRKEQERKRELELQNRVLKKQLGRLNNPKAKPQTVQANAPVSKVKKEKAQASAPAPKANSGKAEHILYAKILKAYKSTNMVELEQSLNLFLKGYRRSVHADNALYLAGSLSLYLGLNDKAMGYFDKLIKEYPEGNKVVAGLYGKAMVQKKLENEVAAHKILSLLIKKYPGSPEAMRASLDVKSMKR